MYFLSLEESRMLQKSLIPQARETGIANELRGWNWHEAPLRPPYGVRLALHEIAGKYCPSGRSTYLKHVRGVKSARGKAMISGVAYHRAVVQTVQEAKRLIYLHGPQCTSRIAEGLHYFQPTFEATVNTDGAEPKKTAGETIDKAVEGGMRKIKAFEETRIVARIEEALSKQPFISADSLAAIALPVTCEHRLDGSFLGLSSLLSCDAASLSGTLIFDLKFGRKRDFHRLSATGYALVMESLWDFPVDFGCTVYVDLRGTVPVVTRDVFFITDELRQWFIDERDDKMRIVAEELDPGVAEECYEYCEYRGRCGEGKAGRSEISISRKPTQGE